MSSSYQNQRRPRSPELGISLGLLPPGTHNTITDVPGVKVGHVTLIRGEGPLVIGKGPVRTGVTAILPREGNLFRHKVIGAVHIINGFGKSLGLSQVAELGVIETPILLTSTLSVWRAADALIDYLAQQNPGVYSFNPVVGECNDGLLNDIIGRHVSKEHVMEALESATTPNTDEGNVGAGTGMRGFGWKTGIGTASRMVEYGKVPFTVGALVLTNTGEAQELRIGGVQVGRHLLPPPQNTVPLSGSIMIVLGTDAPVSSRQLGRMARRASFGLARVGAIAAHDSGDFVIAFSNSANPPSIEEQEITTFFRAVVESVEEAIVNSILRAETLAGRDGNIRHAIPIDPLKALLKSAEV